LPGRL